ncbi:tectonin domain-containing protein [Mucilaginibacter gotjawali]|uniref:Uncharacterized protein n=2 Tax=Mucilaginibacter gotjawali TaxID=1550579 RepID=A0A839SAT7_9SPHI|nr:tectonin domain-containing protein [Mucilaginibacter gotjawali]MBB3055185.1 hypothetical protein [Mucilaginibacter gotjawali]BAU56196.1 Bacterial Ig-like domain group 2 protein [Mucilaginibacter gotjawali]
MKKLILIAVSLIWICSACVKTLTVNPDKSISLTLDTLRLTTGETKQLVSKNYSSNQLAWSSSDTTIATVSAAGMITGKKAGQSVITVNNSDRTVTATCVVLVTAPINGNITQIPGFGTDIGIGADGSVFVVGKDSVSPTGGYSISKLVSGNLVKMPECAAIRIAVSPQGVPWAVNKSHLIFRYNGSLWDQLPGTATDIGIGADGSVFIIGTTTVSPTGGFNILKWNGSDWDVMPQCAGVRIAVSPQGIPWVVNKSNIVYENTGGLLWNPVPGIAANDIGIGADGSVYVTGKDSTNANSPIYKFTNNSWAPVTGASGVSIAVSPSGLPWWVDKSNSIFELKN